MKTLIDKLYLFLFVILYIVLLQASTSSVVFLLFTIISSCLLMLYPFSIHPYISTVILFINIILGCLFSDYILFLPIIFYDTLYQKKYKYSFFFLIPWFSILFNYISYHSFSDFHILTLLHKEHQFSFIICFFIFFMEYIIAFRLCVNSIRENDYHNQLHLLRDQYAEQSLHLIQTNKDLTQKQNDEIYIATLNERNRIAREIHDNVGHMLSRCILQVGALIAVNQDEEKTPFYNSIKETLDEAMNNIRSSVHNLHDESIDLKKVIHKLVSEFTFCEIEFDYSISDNIDTNIKYCFISITKEALHNIIRHSNATKVILQITEHPSFYTYVISDNGTINNSSKKSANTSEFHAHEKNINPLAHNFNATDINKSTNIHMNKGIFKGYEQNGSFINNTESNVSFSNSLYPNTNTHSLNESSSSGIGLSNMRDRVEQLHGTILISNATGFQIHISIPK